MSTRKNFRQSDWPIELSPRKNVEPRIAGIRSTFHGSTFLRLVEIRPKFDSECLPQSNVCQCENGIPITILLQVFYKLMPVRKFMWKSTSVLA